MKWLLLALKSAKFSKLLLSGGSMVLSVFAYGLVFGWPYAVGFVALLFAHELGHYLAARQRNLAVGLPTFIPFVGAWITMKELPHDVETEAYVGLAGPVVGTLAALVCYFWARETGSQLLFALAYAGFMLNLFNLLPISPLDGGRVTAAISRKIWWLGVPLLVYLFIRTESPILLLVALLAAPQLLASFKKGDSDDAYYRVDGNKRLQYGVAYIALAAWLGALSYDLHRMLTTTVG